MQVRAFVAMMPTAKWFGPRFKKLGSISRSAFAITMLFLAQSMTEISVSDDRMEAY